MSIEADLAALARGLESLSRTLGFARVALSEDHPDDTFPSFIDELDASLTDIASGATTACHALEGDRSTLVRSLEACQRHYLRISHLFRDEVLTYDRISALYDHAALHGDRWRAWAEVVHAGLSDCALLFHALDELFLRTWNSAAALANTTTVSVQAIGQYLDTTGASDGPPAPQGRNTSD